MMSWKKYIIVIHKEADMKTKIIRDGIKSMDKKINEMEVDIIDIKVLHEDKVLVMYKDTIDEEV